MEKKQFTITLPAIRIDRRIVCGFIAGIVFSVVLFGCFQVCRDGDGTAKDQTDFEEWVEKNAPSRQTEVAEILQAVSESLRSGDLYGIRDSSSETIAQVQPIVDNREDWVNFLRGLFEKIKTDADPLSAEKIAEMLKSAAAIIGEPENHIRAVKNLESVKNDEPTEKLGPENDCNVVDREADGGDLEGNEGDRAEEASDPQLDRDYPGTISQEDSGNDSGKSLESNQNKVRTSQSRGYFYRWF